MPWRLSMGLNLGEHITSCPVSNSVFVMFLYIFLNHRVFACVVSAGICDSTVAVHADRHRQCGTSVQPL